MSLTNEQSCITHNTVKIKNISITQKVPPCPYSVNLTLETNILFLLPWSSFTCSRTLYEWSHSTYSFVSGFFCAAFNIYHIAILVSHLFMSTIVLYEYTALCSSHCCWTFGLFPVFSYYEQSCYEHFCAYLLINICMHVCYEYYLGVEPNIVHVFIFSRYC